MPYLVFANESNSLEINLLPLGSDRYNILIKGNISSSQIDLKEEFTRSINEQCGTRFEIENIELNNINQDGHKKPSIQGSFKCYVNSQM
tara:strand:+ start:47 stop:313 length:267 start_codon:yes stop_codon:yes gene_type:complete